MAILSSIFLIGFTAMAAQIVIMREFLIVFCGNEITIGFILGSWLIWGAVGSWALGGLADKTKSKQDLFIVCQLVLSLLLVLGILAIRSIRFYFKLSPGQVSGIMPMVISSLLIIAPVCALMGFMFTLGCRIYQIKSAENAQGIGMAYCLESIGAMFGGALLSFIFIRFLDPITISVTLSLLNIFAATYLQFNLRKNRLGVFFVVVFISIIVGGLTLCFFKAWKDLDEYSRRKQWQGYEILEARNSIYGNIMVTKRDNQLSFFDNGLLLYSLPDKLTSEEAVHFALLEDNNPQDLLLVGGGVSGLVSQMLKHPVKSIDYLELDPVIIEMAAKYLPANEYGPLRDKRVTIYNLDGRFFIKNAQNLNKKYDCVITHLGDPYTAQLNRYYTVEFFKEVKNVLKNDGIFSFGLSASESYISPELGEYLSSVYFGLKKMFKDVLVIPGDTAYFMACDKTGVLTDDYNILMDRARERGLDLEYVREYFLFAKLSPRLLNYTKGTLLQNSRIRLNYDFQPSTYYYNMAFWAVRLGSPFFKKILKTASSEEIIIVAFGFCVLIIFWGLNAIRKNRQALKKFVLIALMSTGFSVMAIQMIILLSFQVIYGYMFYKIGVLLTVFMAGLAAGSFWVTMLIKRLRNALNILIQSNLLLCILLSLLPVILYWLSALGDKTLSQLGANIIFPTLSFIAGLISGVQFPSVNKIYLENRDAQGQVAGLTYGVDLLGSCLGALLTGIFLVPVLGINWSCFVIAAINFSVSAILILCRIRL